MTKRFALPVNKWLLAALLTVAVAPLALIPALASGHGKDVTTNSYTRAASCSAATWLVAHYMGSYHSGYSRSNCLWTDGYNWNLGVRAADGALLIAYLRGPRYSIYYRHQ